MELFGIWTWIFFLLLFTIAYWYLSIPKHLPPGTAGVPILGYIPFTNKQVYLTYTELGKTYGNLFYVYFGSQLTIVLNDFATIKEAFVKQGDVFSGRCPIAEFEEIDGNHAGVIFTDGEYWKQHRRFILHNLRDYGVGKPTLEPLLLDEIQYFLKELRGQVGKTIEFKDFLSPSLANNIHILVTGRRFDYDSPSITGLIAAFKAFEKLADTLALSTFFPWVKPILDIIYSERTIELIKMRELNIKLVEDAIRDVKDEYIEGQNGNYLQAYMTERLHRLKTNKNESIFSERGLIHNTRDLLGAGTDTSSSTLAWVAIYMTLHPKVLKKVQQEIDRTIGNREPSYNDRGMTPYTEATICELHRVISLVPLSVPHRTIRRTNLLGYEIPRDAMIFPNIWAVHNDKKLWGDPESFRPERFLNDEGECVKPEYLIPFSIGKRACAGEPLARMEIYLYFVSLIQNFEFQAPPGEKLTTESTPGFARQPQSKMIRLKMRN